jgi:hypothetical protein
MKRFTIAPVAFVAFSVACGPGNAPAGQAGLVSLSAETTLDSIKQPFNAAAGEHRVILLLSPT